MWAEEGVRVEMLRVNNWQLQLKASFVAHFKDIYENINYSASEGLLSFVEEASLKAVEEKQKEQANKYIQAHINHSAEEEEEEEVECMFDIIPLGDDDDDQEEQQPQ